MPPPRWQRMLVRPPLALQPLDQSFHRLAVPTRQWTDVDTLDTFALAAVVHAGADRRAQVLPGTDLQYTRTDRDAKRP